jgi:hypothetical protein
VTNSTDDADQVHSSIAEQILSNKKSQDGDNSNLIYEDDEDSDSTKKSAKKSKRRDKKLDKPAE